MFTDWLPHVPGLLAFAIPYALIVGSTWLLTRILGTRWVLGLFESEGEPSARIILASIVIVFTLAMESADRLSDNKVEANYFLAGSLLGLGTAKLIATRFAARPSTPTVDNSTTKINAETAPVSATNATINQNGPTDVS